MIEPKHVSSELPDLDRTDDPRGGAVAWALLTVSALILAGAALVVIWVW
jgi:hypothetical protein